jgi:hypothetical protein
MASAVITEREREERERASARVKRISSFYVFLLFSE